SVQFKKLGLSATDMFNLFESGMNAGAFNLDKIGDAIKEFSIRAIDGSNTTIDGFNKLGMNAEEMGAKFAKGGVGAKTAFYQVIEAIKNVNDPVKQS
ncbi:TPA: phage tail tape measure protein, partial [Clostridioides difficile]